MYIIEQKKFKNEFSSQFLNKIIEPKMTPKKRSVLNQKYLM